MVSLHYVNTFTDVMMKNNLRFFKKGDLGSLEGWGTLNDLCIGEDIHQTPEGKIVKYLYVPIYSGHQFVRNVAAVQVYSADGKLESRAFVLTGKTVAPQD